MKRILVFLLVAIGFLSIEKAFATRYNVNGKVRYAIELKKLTKAEAQTQFAKGYVDLWAYAYFSQEFVDAGMIQVVDGKITGVLIQFTETTHAYRIQDKYGNLDKSQSIARFAPAENRKVACGRTISQISPPQEAMGKVTFTQGTCCPEWYFGGSGAQTSNIGSIMAPYQTAIITDENGVTWYRLNLYPIRYEWLSMKSFYTSFYTGDSDPADQLGCETDASTFSISYDGQDNPIVPSVYVGNDKDWSYYLWDPNRTGVASDPVKDRCGYIPGGVEVIADPDMQLTADATCGGSDVTGKLNVNDWAGKDWSNYGSVKFYVNATGGSVSGRKLLNSGSDITATPSVPATGSTAPIAYTLTPAGYTLSTGNPADSLIWVIEDTFLA